MYSCYWQSARNRAVHLKYNGLFNNHFISNFIILFAGEKTFKTGKHLVKLQTNVWLSQAPHSFCTFLIKDAELARLLVYNRQKVLINVAILISRLIWLHYNKNQTAVGNFWLTDWSNQCMTNCWSCASFCCSISLFVAAVLYGRSWNFLKILLLWKPYC